MRRHAAAVSMLWKYEKHLRSVVPPLQLVRRNEDAKYPL